MTDFDEAVDLLINTCSRQRDRADEVVETARENLVRAGAERNAIHVIASSDILLLGQIRDAYYEDNLIYTQFLLGSLGKRGEFLRKYL